MVGEIRPHSRQVDDPTVGPDSRAEQDRRAAVHAGAEDDVPGRDARRVREPYAHGPSAVEDDPVYLGLGADAEVGRRAVERQVGINGRDAPPAEDVHRHPAGADGARLVVIVDRREAGGGQRIDCGAANVREVRLQLP